MFWIYLVIIAHLINAVVFVIDRGLLVAPIPNPLSYAFYVSVLSGIAILLLPLGVRIPPAFDLLVAVASGLSFFISLIYLYKSLRMADIIETAPAIGAISAVTTFLANAAFLHESFSVNQLIAFALLIIGSLIMSYFHLKDRVALYIVISGVMLGISFSTLKYFFTATDFVNGLFWTRLALVASGLALLLSARARGQIFGSYEKAPVGSRFLFVFNKTLSGAAYVVLYYAVKIGSVVFVNALQGLQYVFLLVISVFLVKKMPALFEKHVKERFWRKLTATFVIVAGFILLFV